MTKRRKKHRPEDMVAKLRNVDAILNAGRDLAGSSTGGPSTAGCSARKPENLEDENRPVKELVADQAFDIQMLRLFSRRHL